MCKSSCKVVRSKVYNAVQFAACTPAGCNYKIERRRATGCCCCGGRRPRERLYAQSTESFVTLSYLYRAVHLLALKRGRLLKRDTPAIHPWLAEPEKDPLLAPPVPHNFGYSNFMFTSQAFSERAHFCKTLAC